MSAQVLQGLLSSPGEDREQLAKLRRKDPGAFEALVRAHQDRVFDFCFRMLGDREEASDVTQEVFVSVHENLGRFREDSKLSTWIFRICKNQCLNRIKYLRRRGRGLSEGLDMLTDADWLAMGGGPPRPDEALAAAREQALVQRAIAQLEDEHRLLVVLRDIEGLSYDEIVEVTDLPEGTVKSRLHRAREQLGRLLGAERDAEARRSAT